MTSTAQLQIHAEIANNEHRFDSLSFEELWLRLAKRKLRLVSCEQRYGTSCAVLAPGSDGPPLSNWSVSIAQRVLCGEYPKALASSFQVSPSTISQHISHVFRTMGAQQTPSKVSILLVMAALAASGVKLPAARLEAGKEPGRLSLCAASPGQTFRERLTSSEFDVVTLLIESRSYAEIAALRHRSQRTIANQLASAFRKLRVSGQNHLRATAVLELARGYTNNAQLSCSAPSSPVRSGAPSAGISRVGVLGAASTASP